ncbi:MAG TPA: hypothetical protein EYP57_03290 [Thermodesulfobacteriaceae bacterium]|nr:hypothetical protein [Thermodesulfobacteriaceae bacterium]
MCIETTAFFTRHEEHMVNIYSLVQEMRGCYAALEPFCHDFTKHICGKCPTPCCVNRHGLPDFEDLVTFRAMNLVVPAFNFDA